jgi:rod shape-determining protein MreD
MKFLVTAILAGLLLTVESVVVKYLGLSVIRIDVSVALIAFIALRSGLVEGALSSFVAGYLLDMMSGQPTGLYTFLGVLTFLIARVADSFVEVRRPMGFAFFAMGADFGHGVLAAAFRWLISKDGQVFTGSLQGLHWSVLWTGLAALLLFPLLDKLIKGESRPEPGLLR